MVGDMLSGIVCWCLNQRSRSKEMQLKEEKDQC